MDWWMNKLGAQVLILSTKIHFVTVSYLTLWLCYKGIEWYKISGRRVSMQCCIHVRHYLCCYCSWQLQKCLSEPLMPMTVYLYFQSLNSTSQVFLSRPRSPYFRVPVWGPDFETLGLLPAKTNNSFPPSIHLVQFLTQSLALWHFPYPSHWLLPSWSLTTWNQPTFLFALLPWACWPITT